MNIELLNTEVKHSQAELVAKMNEIIEALNNASAPRDRGPKSERVMTDEDARRVIFGDLKDVSHKAAAEALELSYGQIYSARKGFTFKPIHKELEKQEKQA
jgi:hypothetical protein